MKKVMFIGEYLLSFPGGAEKSIFNELKSLKSKYEISAITFDVKHTKSETVEEIKIINYPMQRKCKISRFYSLYILNKEFVFSKLIKHLKKLQKCEYVIIQAVFAPLIAEFCIKHKIPYVYYVRDELQLNQFRNYETGIKYLLKGLKDIVEFYPILKFKSLNRKAMINAKKVVVNSKFIQKGIKNKFGVKSELKYPPVEKIVLNKRNPKYVTFIGGGNSQKGWDLVKKIIKQMPETKFLIVGPYKKKHVKNNVTFLPWQKDMAKVYRETKLLITPSKWDEAFGRVVIEANNLKIPVITSNKGGLPEANPEKSRIINNRDSAAWVLRIKELL